MALVLLTFRSYLVKGLFSSGFEGLCPQWNSKTIKALLLGMLIKLEPTSFRISNMTSCVCILKCKQLSVFKFLMQVQPFVMNPHQRASENCVQNCPYHNGKDINHTCLSISGLHHLHGGPGRTIWVQRSRCWRHLPGWVGGPPGAVWSPVPPAVPRCYVQQWQQGRQPAVPHLQDHLRSQDRQSTPWQDGVPRHPPLAARPPWLQNHPYHLQHPSWHPGKVRLPMFTWHQYDEVLLQGVLLALLGWCNELSFSSGPRAPKPRQTLHCPWVPQTLLPPWQREGTQGKWENSSFWPHVQFEDYTWWPVSSSLSPSRFWGCFWWRGTGGSFSPWARPAPPVSLTQSSGTRCTTRRSLAPTWRATATPTPATWTTFLRSLRLRASLRRSVYPETEQIK